MHMNLDELRQLNQARLLNLVPDHASGLLIADKVSAGSRTSI
jgi:hypothetical protein